MNFNLQHRIEIFWQWFEENHEQLRASYDANDVNQLTQILDTPIKTLHPKIGWELGPTENAANDAQSRDTIAFTLTPRGVAELFAITESIIAHAPTKQGWEFRPYRFPKAWDGSFELFDNLGHKHMVSTKLWSYALLAYPGERTFDVEIFAPLSGFSHELRQQAAYVALDSELGEKFMTEHVRGVVVETQQCDIDSVTPFEYLHEHLAELMSHM